MSRLLRLHRTLALTPPARRLNSSFTRGPAPQRLPPDQQAEFERLQRQASVSSAFQHLVEDAPDATPAATTTTSSSPPSDTVTAAATAAASDAPNTPTPTVAAADEDTMHPNYVRGAPPEFEGDVNPRTGEVGGPKREPLRWGAAGDWSYNGRVTDF